MMPDREKVTIDEKLVIVGLAALKEDYLMRRCGVNSAVIDRAIELLKEQEHKDRMYHALEDDWKRLKELLKEQETANLYKCPNCGTWVSAENVVRCKDCKHGSLYCTEDVCGETLIECNRPDLGDVIEIHGWKWFCADGERKEGR